MTDRLLFPSYENDYILRSLGGVSIVTQPDIALTELVANAWDAGASHVNIFIPDSTDQFLYIEDDGTGMTEDEFENHWMKLRYNRIIGQGKNVIFPDGINNKRVAFGRNGIGRHSLFCFGEEYKVITSKNGIKNTFVVKPNISSQPFAVTARKEEKDNSHGTRLEVCVTKNLPDPHRIAEILSARFLHDPQFSISVNHMCLDLSDLIGDVNPKVITIDKYSIELTAYFIDTTKAGRKSIFQGIAFWQSGRLVGEPSWTLGKLMVLDGRVSLAKYHKVQRFSRLY
jgi:hypothetical protein